MQFYFLLSCFQSSFVHDALVKKYMVLLQVSRWVHLYETTVRVIEDIRFVLSHVVVSKYVTNDHQDISRTWMKLLSYVQGMNPQKREMNQLLEEENDNVHLPFVLGHSIANIHSLLVDGAFSDASKGEVDDEIVWSTDRNESDDGDDLRHAKVGRLSQESSACNLTSKSSVFASSQVLEIKYDTSSHLLPCSATWLIHESLRAVENWLGVENTPEVLPNMLSSNSGTGNFSAFKRTISNFRRGKLKTNDEIGSENTSARSNFDNVRISEKYLLASSNDSTMEEDFPVESDGLRSLSLPDWPQIVYDVSSQDISVHIPFHRFLSMLLQKALRRYFCESEVPVVTDISANSSSTIYNDFFGHALRGSHPYGFSAFIMEHPLRIRVFCAEVHAGMWRKNGDAALLSCEWYRSVRW